MDMANVLNEEKKQQVLALGRLGWSLRRIQQATKIRRETASTYLKAAGIAVRLPSGWGRCEPKPANEVITDSGAAKPAIPVIPDACNPNPENPSNKGRSKATSKPANENEVITDSAVVSGPALQRSQGTARKIIVRANSRQSKYPLLSVQKEALSLRIRLVPQRWTEEWHVEQRVIKFNSVSSPA